MLIENAGMCGLLRRIVAHFTLDHMLQDDLMQECLIHLWRLESAEPGQATSWYLQNCRFHLQHCLGAGRSVDSHKRDNGDKRIPIDGDTEELAAHGYHTNGESFALVVVRDLLTTLSRHLNPRERAVLGGLAHGLVLHEIAADLKVSYPTALKSRRKIAALTVKLGVSPPRRDGKRSPQQRSKANGTGPRDGA